MLYKLCFNYLQNREAAAEAHKEIAAVGPEPIEVRANVADAEHVERLVVGNWDGRPIYVRDVARVRHMPEDAKRVVTHFTGPASTSLYPADGAQAVTIAIAKKEGTNGVTVAKAVLEKLEKLKGVLIPSNVQVEITRDYGKTANDKVNDLIFKLFVATGFVFLLVLWSFRALRPAIVVVLDSGTLALSSGPVFDPAGQQVATFTSIWRREAKGVWRIVFDKGNQVCPPPSPAAEDGSPTIPDGAMPDEAKEPQDRGAGADEQR